MCDDLNQRFYDARLQMCFDFLRRCELSVNPGPPAARFSLVRSVRPVGHTRREGLVSRNRARVAGSEVARQSMTWLTGSVSYLVYSNHRASFIRGNRVEKSGFISLPRGPRLPGCGGRVLVGGRQGKVGWLRDGWCCAGCRGYQTEPMGP